MATITWRGAASGDWSVAGNWSGDAVPGSADAAAIGPFSSATAWIVAATDQAAGALLLDAGALGTLAVGGSLSVATTLSIASGTFIAAAGSRISDGAFAMTGGAATLDGARQIDGSADADIASGTVAVLDGGIWITGGLGIGTGGTGDVAAGQGAVLLGSASGGGTLAVPGAIAVGADEGTGSLRFSVPGGTGTLAVADDSLAAAQSLAILNHSTVSVDATSAVALGDATPLDGAVAVGSNANLSADIGAIAGNLDNAGSVDVMVFLSGLTAASGDLDVSGTLTNSGRLEVEASSTLAVGGDLIVQGGVLQAATGATVGVAGIVDMTGGTLATGSGAITATGLVMSGGNLVVDGGTLSAGADLFGGGAVVEGGGTWDAASLVIAGAEADTTDPTDASLGLQAGAGGGGGTLATIGALAVGADSLFVTDQQYYDGGGAGVLTLAGGSRATAASLSLQSAQGTGEAVSTISVDEASALMIGGIAPVAGAIAIASGASLTADIGRIVANIVDEGALIGQSTNAATGNDEAAADLTIAGSLSGTGLVSLATAGTLAVSNAHGFAGGITLDNLAELVLDASDAPSARITVASGTATVDLEGQTYAAFNIPLYDATTGELTVGTATIDPGRGYAPSQFTVQPDSTGGSDVVINIACFAAGTRLATPVGETPVERIRPGERVRTHDGSVETVRWVGWTRIDLSRHPAPARAAPIRVRAGAFADGVPHRDLLVSPEHCLLVGGVLVPAFLVANGATIARDDSFSAITYWHVELDRHRVLLAEGLPAESFLDTGNRALFAGEAGARALHPELAGPPDQAALRVWAARGCAKLQLDATTIRARLRARAEHLGWRLSDNPALSITANGAALPIATTRGGVRARLPAGTTEARLLTKTFVPAELCEGSGDTRRLGVAVAGVDLAGWPLHPDALRQGWHDAAGEGWRWTDGDARIVLPRLVRPTELDVRLGCAGRYWALSRTAADAVARSPRRRASAESASAPAGRGRG